MQPIPYTRQYSFTGFSSNYPSDQQPGGQLDAELNAAKQTLDGLVANIALLQRDDGSLTNNSVSMQTLASDVLSVIGALNSNWQVKGAWLTGTGYALGNVIAQGVSSYVCATVHTSGVFATDLAAGKWVTLWSNVDFSAITVVINTAIAAAIASAAPNGAAVDLSNLTTVNHQISGPLGDMNPIGNGAGTKTHFNLLMDAVTESATVRQFDFALGANYSKGTANSGSTDAGAKCLFYGGVNMMPGCYKAWAGNTLLHINPGVTVEYVNNFEFDIDNYSGVDYGAGIGAAGLVGASVWGITINGQNPGNNTITGGMCIIASNAGGPNYERGYVVAPGAVRQAGFDDYSGGTYSYRDLGAHSVGMELSGTYSVAGVRVPNNVPYTSKRLDGLTASLAVLDGTNNLQLGSGNVVNTFACTSFYPISDNTKALGGPTFRWARADIVDPHFSPLASQTPAVNGEMVLELTSNTLLKIKVKGSDGVVRSTSLTLA